MLVNMDLVVNVFIGDGGVTTMGLTEEDGVIRINESYEQVKDVLSGSASKECLALKAEIDRYESCAITAVKALASAIEERDAAREQALIAVRDIGRLRAILTANGFTLTGG